MGDLSAHFSKKEFSCHCGCGFNQVKPELISKLEKFRELCGNKPMTINSGCRCEKRNKAVGGAQKKYDKNGKLIVKVRSTCTAPLPTLSKSRA